MLLHSIEAWRWLSRGAGQKVVVKCSREYLDFTGHEHLLETSDESAGTDARDDLDEWPTAGIGRGDARPFGDPCVPCPDDEPRIDGQDANARQWGFFASSVIVVVSVSAWCTRAAVLVRVCRTPDAFRSVTRRISAMSVTSVAAACE